MRVCPFGTDGKGASVARLLSRRRVRGLPFELSLRRLEKVDILWSKGVGDYCDFGGTRDYRLDGTESTRPADFFAHSYAGAHGLIWIRLGTIARDGRTCDLDTFAETVLPIIAEPFVLITTDGDLSVPSQLRPQTVALLKAHPMMRGWYSQNADGSDPAVVPFPIGLDLHTPAPWTTPLRLLAQLGQIGRDAPAAASRPLRVFSDLGLSLTAARREAHAAVAGCGHVDLADRRVSRIDIWRRYASYPFVMSAHGNGLDCHRTWEVLCLGGIPIVKTSSLDPLYRGLPVAIVEDWREVRDMARLERWLERLAPLADAEAVRARLDPRAWLSPLRDLVSG